MHIGPSEHRPERQNKEGVFRRQDSNTTTTTPSSSSTGPNTSILSGSTSTSSIATSTSSSEPAKSDTASNSTIPGISSPNSGVSNGVAAGIGIGTFLAGVLLAALGIFLFMKMKTRKARSSRSGGLGQSIHSTRDYHENDTPLKGMSTNVREQEQGSYMKLERIMLEPIAGGDIKKDMMAIGNQILQHVDNNYHLKEIEIPSSSVVKALSDCRYDTSIGVSLEQMAILLRDVQFRRIAVRHLITWFVFSRISLTSDAETSLLPAHITSFLRKIPRPESTTGSREAFDQMLTKWRVISAYLLQTVRSNRDPLLPKETDVQSAITRNIRTINKILQPFVTPGAERRQEENLRGIMFEGSAFGLLLFQQAITWKIDWELRGGNSGQGRNISSRSGTRNSLIVSPALIKVADEEGRSYTDMRMVVEPEVVQF